MVCPVCGYSIRLPIVGMVGAFLVIGGLMALLYALFSGDMWIDIAAGGLGAIVLGMVGLLVAGLMIGRARRA